MLQVTPTTAETWLPLTLRLQVIRRFKLLAALSLRGELQEHVSDYVNMPATQLLPDVKVGKRACREEGTLSFILAHKTSSGQHLAETAERANQGRGKLMSMSHFVARDPKGNALRDREEGR